MKIKDYVNLTITTLMHAGKFIKLCSDMASNKTPH